jgi:hypothetical protein
MAMSPEELIEAKSRLYGGLNGVFEPGEQPLVIINGPSQQAVVGTDRRLFVYKSGNKAGAMWRRKVASWAYADVADIQLLAGEKSGSIWVQPLVPDVHTGTYGAAGHGSAQQAPNAISLASRPGPLIESRVEFLRSMVAEARGAGSGPPQGETSADIAEEIRSLGALREEGAITEEEFQAKKAQLLERM